MSCTSPLYRVPFASQAFPKLFARDQARLKNHGVFLKYDAVLNYQSLPGFPIDDIQVLRCGQCTDCRLKSSFDWAVRCSLEASEHEYNYFITLTYDDVHIPSGDFIDYNGDVWSSNLDRRDIQLFVKKLREHERTYFGNTGIKVFYCGEYGGITGRPHFHICVFGVSKIPDLVKSYTKGAYNFYKSVLYESFWSTDEKLGISVPRGFVDISEVSFDSIAYTARYILKKQKGLVAKDFLDYYDGLDPSARLPIRKQPFIGMSLKPAIGSSYYEKNKLQIYDEDLVKFQKKYELFKAKPPRYFDKLFDSEFPDDFDKLRRQRKALGVEARKVKKLQYAESELSRMKREEYINKAKEDRYYVRNL